MSVSMSSARVCAVVALSFALVACDGRWELKEDHSGRMFRIDKWLGDVTVVSENSLVKLRTSDELAAAAKPQTWPDINLMQPLRITASLKTAWRDGQLHYKLLITPSNNKGDLKEQLRSKITSFTLALSDSGGFRLLSLTVPLARMVSLVDDAGVADKLEAQSAESCSFECHSALRLWNVAWSAVKTEDRKSP